LKNAFIVSSNVEVEVKNKVEMDNKTDDPSNTHPTGLVAKNMHASPPNSPKIFDVVFRANYAPPICPFI
jgi:hypothetical protein